MSYLNSIQDKATLDAAQAFIATASSRETSEELMEAIFRLLLGCSREQLDNFFWIILH